MPVEPSQIEGAIDVPSVQGLNAVTSTLGLVGGLAGLGSGAIRLAEGGDKASGATELASGAVTAANALGADIPYAGPALALAQIGEGAAEGGQIGDRAAVQGAMSLAGSAVPGIGAVFTAGNLAQTLINLGLGEYKQGDLSKAIMNAKQQHLYQYGNQAEEQALKAAPNFRAALSALRHAPASTSGQVQFGVGNEYAGETLVGAAGTTETSNWDDTVRKIADPVTLRDHPDLVADFIWNLWVQTGPSGAAAFNGGATRNYQVSLLAKLPNTPEWLTAKQKILNSESVDPRDVAARDKAMAAAPDLPIEPGFLHVGGLRIPTDHAYKSFNGSNGIWYDVSPERVAQTGTYNLMDVTTGKWVGEGGNPHRGPDPAYLDNSPVGKGVFKDKLQASWNDYMANRDLRPPGTYDPEGMAWVAKFLGISPPGETLAPEFAVDYSGGMKEGGYVAAKLDRPVPITVHGGEYVVPRGPLAEGLKAVLGPGPLRPGGATR